MFCQLLNFINVKGLGYIIKNPGLHYFYRVVHLTLAGHDDYHQRLILFQNFTSERKTVLTSKINFNKSEPNRMFPEQLPCLRHVCRQMWNIAVL